MSDHVSETTTCARHAHPLGCECEKCFLYGCKDWECACGHSAGSHNATHFNCLATTAGTHATRCRCRKFTLAAPLDAGRATETEERKDEDRLRQVAANFTGGRLITASEALMAVAILRTLDRLTALRARLDASERVREAAAELLAAHDACQPAHATVRTDVEIGRVFASIRALRASLAPTPEGMRCE
jgi:hypothetical protein